MEKHAENSAVPVTGRRWLYAGLGGLLLFFLGLIYTWSVFIPSLEKEFGWERADATMPFSVLIAMFCLGCLTAGFVSRRLSGRLVVRVAAVALGGGFALAAVSNNLVNMCLAYGVVVGLGAGLAYNTVLATMVKWFPDRLGSVAGLMLMGLGCGSFFLSLGGSWLLEFLDWRKVFLLFGGLNFALFMGLSGYVVPPAANILFPERRGLGKGARKASESAGDLPTVQMVRRPAFLLFFAWAVVISSAGLALVGHAAPMAKGLGMSSAAVGFAAGLVSLFNGFGRSIFGACFDLFGRRMVMPTASCGFVLAGVLLLLCLRSESALLLNAALVLGGLCYGGVMPSTSTVIGTFYGLKYYQQNLSVAMLSLLPASFIGPYVAGMLHSVSNSYFPTAVLLMVLGGLGLGLSLLIRRP